MDLNKVSKEQLQKIGINENLAESIVQYRKQRGGFRSWDNVRNGFDDDTVERLRNGGITL